MTAYIQNPQIAGNETINGIATVKVTGTIDGAVIDPVVPQLGKGGGTLPITLYIVDTGAPGSGKLGASATYWAAMRSRSARSSQSRRSA